MAKKKLTEWYCPECGFTSPKFFGMCKCGEGVGEERRLQTDTIIVKGKEISSKVTLTKDAKNIKDVNISDVKRFSTGFKQIDNVFGGSNNNKGVMPNSLNVFFGRPGIGKSTLLMQIINNLSQQNKNCFYVTAEENPEQLKERYNRLGLKADFSLTDEYNTLNIKEMSKDSDFIIIDSINSLYLPDTGVIGGVAQINANVMLLMKYAKEENKTIIIISHVTKDGTITGSNFFKHMVDGVFEFSDMEEDGIYRIVQSGKNRFGKSDETAILKMTSSGLVEVEDPSFIFIDDNDDSFGNATSMILQGNRPIFIDIESLVTSSNSDNKIYNVVGFDNKKYMQILAIITKYLEVFIYEYNVFTNIAGGVKIKNEPQIDLAVIASILSSQQEFNINNFIFIGEVSLNGSIRKHKLEEIFIEHCKKMNINKKIISYGTGYKHIKDLLEIF
jgi:DNA repair protein RadA/Sms